jgi:hypothetical protein
VAASYKRGSHPSGSTKGKEFLDYLNDYQLPKKDFAARNELQEPSVMLWWLALQAISYSQKWISYPQARHVD